MKDNLPRWDLSPIYSSIEGNDFNDSLNLVSILSSKLTTMINNHESLYSIIENLNELVCNVFTLYSYVNALLTTDTSNPLYIKTLSKLEDKFLEFNKVQTLLTSKIETYQDEFQDERLKEYSFMLNELLEESKHMMSLEAEELASDLARSGVNAFERLYDSVSSSISDGTKTVIQLRGDSSNPDREIRLSSYEKEKEVWKTHEIAFAAALNSIKGTTLTLEKRRGWGSPIEHSAFNSRLSMKALNALITTLENNLETFRSYFRAKAKLLGLKDLEWCDLIAPVGAMNKEYSFQEASELIISCFSKFSPKMGAFAKNAFENNWIDAESRKGKVGGAYDTSLPLRKQSRILCNYDYSFDAVSTLAHELGHAFHDSVVMKEKALLAEYPMTVAETASIFAEQVLFNQVLENANEEESIALIDQLLIGASQVCVDILSRYYFEESVFNKRKDGELTADEFTALMKDAQDRTYGDAVLNKHNLMWCAKGHYYSSGFSFYNYPYAFGQLFALALYNISKAKDNFEDKYIELLSLTGKASANTVASSLNCDIEDVAFWQKGVDEIKVFVDKLVNYANKN